jgi:rod shape-determining protein MreC
MQIAPLANIFLQVQRIERLELEVAQLKQVAYLATTFANEINSYLAVDNKQFAPEIEPIRAISYAEMGDMNKVWLEFEDFNTSRIYGLLYQGLSAGIVVQKDGMALGLLQGSPQCIFSIVIGDDQIPGIIYGNGEDMLIKFIPPWSKPKVGDEVVTSGLDNIFVSGIKVGKITEVIPENAYTTATLKPYVNVNIPNYFHTIKKLR